MAGLHVLVARFYFLKAIKAELSTLTWSYIFDLKWKINTWFFSKIGIFPTQCVNYLWNTFSQRCIERSRWQAWPSHSIDLTLMNFHLWRLISFNPLGDVGPIEKSSLNSIFRRVLHHSPSLAFFFNLVFYCPSTCYPGSARFSPYFLVSLSSLLTCTVIRSHKAEPNLAILLFFYSLCYLNLLHISQNSWFEILFGVEITKYL